jgi:hypothetical protein
MPDVAAEMGRGDLGGSPVTGDRTEDARAVVRNASIELVVDDGAAAIDAAEARPIASAAASPRRTLPRARTAPSRARSCCACRRTGSTSWSTRSTRSRGPCRCAASTSST